MSAKAQLQKKDGKVYASSLDLARNFNKRHVDVVRAIETQITAITSVFSGYELGVNLRNFAQVSNKENHSQQEKMFLLTRLGFCFIALGLTGKEAVRWKFDYIKAFNEMESELQRHNYKFETFKQLSLFPEFETAIGESRPVISMSHSIGVMTMQGMNIPPVTRDTLKREMGKGNLEGCRINGVTHLFVDSLTSWIERRQTEVAK
jgi:Rha family phage regulatory protein